MESVRVIIAMANEAALNKMKAVLVDFGYIVIDQAREGNECLRKIRALKPDFVIVEYSIPSISGPEIARVAIEDGICDVILLAAEAEANLLDDMRDEAGFACLTKPLNKTTLANTIDLMSKSKKKIRQLEKEIQSLRATIDTRKEVDRAKGLLMKHMNLTEPEAFKRIQKQSMDKGIPMKEIAKAIILAYEI